MKYNADVTLTLNIQYDDIEADCRTIKGGQKNDC